MSENLKANLNSGANLDENLKTAAALNAQTPLLSVLITTYNRKNLLQKAVQSVLAQDFKDLEIIISDDGSNDGTREFCEDLIKQNAKIRYVLNEKYKKGPNGNKNNALDYARGQFVQFLDDDDELMPHALSTLLNKAKEGYAHVFGNCLLEKNGVLSKELSGKGFEKDGEVSKKDFLMGRFHGEFLGTFKKSLLENKRFNDAFYGNEATLWVNLYKEKSFYIHKPLRIYRVNSGASVTQSANKHAKAVFMGYLEMARIIEAEFIATKDKDLRAKCAQEYKMAAYYAKFAGLFGQMFACIFKSLRVKFNKEALILLALSFMPKKFLEVLSKFRARLASSKALSAS